MNRKLNVFLSLTLALIFVLAACAPASTPTSAPATDAPTAAPVVTEAPVDPMAALVEESKAEKDGLLVYSIMGENNWAPVIKAFNEKYPWITVTALDLGTTETFERYYTESAGGARTADMIITSAPGEWQEFIAKGELDVYTPVNAEGLPDFAKLADGVYAVSTDPFILIWNKALVPNPPASLDDVAKLAADPAFQGKITTYDVEKNGTGHAMNWFWIKKMGDAGWTTLGEIGKSTVNMQTSAGNMVKAVLSGEAAIGYFVSGISVFPKFPDADAVMGWAYDKSGQVVVVRGMGITAKASSPASAKLLMEFILSAEGQLAWSEGGLTAYRPDVAGQAEHHLQGIIDAVGADNIIYFYFDPDMASAANRQAFVDKWKQVMGRP